MTKNMFLLFSFVDRHENDARSASLCACRTVPKPAKLERCSEPESSSHQRGDNGLQVFGEKHQLPCASAAPCSLYDARSVQLKPCSAAVAVPSLSIRARPRSALHGPVQPKNDYKLYDANDKRAD